MGSLVAILFPVLLIGMGVFMVKYARVLTEIVDCSNESGVAIFRARYKNVYHLMADISFLNTLWGKGCQKQIPDLQLSELVAKAHRMLRAQVLIGLFVFFVPFTIGVVRIGG